MADEAETEDATLKDDLEAAYAELSAREQVDGEQDAPAAAQPEAKPVEPPDEAGEGDTEGDEPAAGDGDEAAAASEEAAEEADDDIAPDPSWNDEQKATWEKLPKDGRKLAHDVIKGGLAELETRTTALTERERAVERLANIDRAFQPYQDMLRAKGIDEATAVRSLLAAQYQLEQNAPQALAWLARQYGVDIAQLGGQPAEDADDPDVQLNRMVNQRVQPLEDQFRQLVAGQQSQRMAAVQAQIDAFRSAKDDQGNLAHPHFDKVIDDVNAVMVGSAPRDGHGNIIGQPTLTLDQAYERAVWGNAELRSEILKADQEAGRKKAEDERRAEVAKAKKAGKVLKGRDSPGEERPEFKDQKAEIAHIWDQLAGA